MTGLAQLAIILWFLLAIRPTLDAKDRLIRSATQLVVILSLTDVVATISLNVGTNLGNNLMFAGLFLNHFIACLFLPWTAWQSLKAIAPALIAWWIHNLAAALIGAWGEGASGELMVAVGMIQLLWLGLILFMFIPGILICWYRLRVHGRRFLADRLGRHFLSMRRELQQARGIHESLFPEQLEEDRLAFRYLYRPETDIGGDFVWFDREGSVVRLLLLDVTGHGLPAALTVNRIHGEILRIRAEHPEGDPALLMSLLDRYFALTLAPHQIFATGIAIELDTVTGRLSWVNAGHPPAFVLGIGDAFEELGTTAIMLGAQEPGAFVPDQQETHIRPESRILAYTDGITEARDPDGTMLGIDRLRSLIRNADPDAEWPRQLRVFASNFAHGRFTDDVLAVSLEFRAEGAPS